MICENHVFSMLSPPTPLPDTPHDAGFAFSSQTKMSAPCSPSAPSVAEFYDMHCGRKWLSAASQWGFLFDLFFLFALYRVS